MGKRSRRSDRDRKQIFGYFINKRPQMQMFRAASVIDKKAEKQKYHDQLMAKSKKRIRDMIKAWLKAKLKAIFKVA